MNKTNLGPIKDMPCSICGESGNTTGAIYATLYNIVYCNKHSTEEVVQFKNALHTQALEKYFEECKHENI